MKTTSPITLVVSGLGAGVLGGLYGYFQVSHGHPLPVAHPSSLFTMPAIAVVLIALAYPIYRYRKQSLDFAKKPADAPRAARPKRLDPFYAVRVLLLAKSTSVTSAIIAGFQVGLVVLQLTTPVISGSVWLNVFGVVGGLVSMAAALAVERICRIPDGGIDASNGEAAA